MLAAAVAALGLAAAVAVAPAGAQEPTGGTAPAPEPAPDSSAPPAAAERAAELAPPPTANLYGRPAPRIRSVSCRSDCGAGGAARPGSLLRISGRNLKPLDDVIFPGALGDADDTSVAPRRVRRRSVLARVPRTAVSGSIVVARADGTRSPAWSGELTVEAQPVEAPAAGIVEAEVQDHKVFFGARRPAELSYVIGGDEPADVAVELVRASDATVVQRWTPGAVQPGVPQTLRWNGMAGGAVQRDGLYQFRVIATAASGSTTTSAPAITPPTSSAKTASVSPQAAGAFNFVRYRFPLLGAHYFGEGAARFGGGRGHQGQDVFADCGTPILAARGGVVKFRQFQSAAGNYVVIDGARTGTDFAYMHLREAAIVDVGDRVRTGQPIGFVGDTGRADGCHLHFEEWTAPGWYSGGSPFDPLPDLRSWDARS